MKMFYRKYVRFKTLGQHMNNKIILLEIVLLGLLPISPLHSMDISYLTTLGSNSSEPTIFEFFYDLINSNDVSGDRQKLLGTKGVNAAGKTDLIIATHDQDLTLVKKLLQQEELMLDHQDKNGDTALLIAVEKNNEQITELLLEIGADPNICNKWGYSPLYLAINNNNKKIIKLLLTHKALVETINNALEINASAEYTFDLVKRLNVEKEVKKIIRKALDKQYSSYSNLIRSVLSKNKEHIKTFIEQADQQNLNRALFISVASGYPKITGMLIEGGAQVNAVNKKGNSPLMVAFLFLHNTLRCLDDYKSMKKVNREALENTMSRRTKQFTDIITQLLNAGAQTLIINKEKKDIFDLMRDEEIITTTKKENIFTKCFNFIFHKKTSRFLWDDIIKMIQEKKTDEELENNLTYIEKNSQELEDIDLNKYALN